MKKFIITSKLIKRNAINAVMEKMGEDNMEVIIQKHKEDKTAEQRGWFHALCKTLGEETGYTQAEIKELIKKAIIGTKMVKVGGYEKEVTESSESLDKIGYSELIEGAYRIGAEAGIQLPNPDKWNR